MIALNRYKKKRAKLAVNQQPIKMLCCELKLVFDAAKHKNNHKYFIFEMIQELCEMTEARTLTLYLICAVNTCCFAK